MRGAGLGAPTALPSWRALCPGSPSGRQSACLASLTGSPGNRGAARALRVPFRGGEVRALGGGRKCSGAQRPA